MSSCVNREEGTVSQGSKCMFELNLLYTNNPKISGRLTVFNERSVKCDEDSSDLKRLIEIEGRS